jgi:hypothetical protein
LVKELMDEIVNAEIAKVPEEKKFGLFGASLWFKCPL